MSSCIVFLVGFFIAFSYQKILSGPHWNSFNKFAYNFYYLFLFVIHEEVNVDENFVSLYITDIDITCLVSKQSTDCSHHEMTIRETDKHDWESHLKVNLRMLKIMGLWPDDDKIYKPGLYTFYTGFIVICVAIYILIQAINIYFIIDNLKAVVGSVYILLIACMATFKVYYMIKNIKILKVRMQILRSDWFQPKNNHQRGLIEPSISFWRNVYKAMLVSCSCCDIFWAIYPILDASSEEKRLPFPAWYPFDYKISPFYEIAYFHQVFATTYLTFIHLNVDTLIAGFNVYTGCQFDLLCDNLRNYANMENASDNAHAKLIDCVKHHRNILGFVETCAETFNWLLFLHLLVSGVSIGITMFQLTVVVPLSNEFYSLLSYDSALIVQIFMYCWFGNDVEVKSNKLNYAIFESNWTDLSLDVKKKMLFFTMHLMEPVKISAFHIFDYSLDTFMKILKTAWSYFALLHQVSSGN